MLAAFFYGLPFLIHEYAMDPIPTTSLYRLSAEIDGTLAEKDNGQSLESAGAFFAVADVSDRIRPGVVASTKGRWPGCSKEGATINATVDDRDSDMGGGALYHDNRVRVERIRQEVI